jgi:capsular exopolysaccharide synthesis family protein
MDLDLRHYLEILQRYSLIILLVMLLTVVVMLTASLWIPPIYRAQATVRVLQNGGQEFGLSIDYGERLMNTYQYVLTSWNMLGEVARRLERNDVSIPDIADEVEVEIIPKSELMTISFSHRDPKFARDFANMMAIMLVEYNENTALHQDGPSTVQVLGDRLHLLQQTIYDDQEELARLLTERGSESQIEILKSRIQINETSYLNLLTLYEQARLNASVQARSVSVVEYATLPTVPANILSLRQIALTLIAGLFGGVALALIFENMDTHIHTPHQLEHLTNLPVIGIVAPRQLLSDTQASETPTFLKYLPFSTNGASNKQIEEAYRLLSVRLDRLKEQQEFKTVLITSATSQEAKTNLVLNLAQIIAKERHTVFIVESNIRNPTIHHKLNLKNDMGLTSFLAGLSTLQDIIQPTDLTTLYVVGSGPTAPNPANLLDSPRMDDIITYLGNQAYLTLFDAMPILGTADTSIVAAKVDGVILVVRQDVTDREKLKEAILQLEAAQAKLLGTIFLQRK